MKADERAKARHDDLKRRADERLFNRFDRTVRSGAFDREMQAHRTTEAYRAYKKHKKKAARTLAKHLANRASKPAPRTWHETVQAHALASAQAKHRKEAKWRDL